MFVPFLVYFTVLIFYFQHSNIKNYPNDLPDEISIYLNKIHINIPHILNYRVALLQI